MRDAAVFAARQNVVADFDVLLKFNPVPVRRPIFRRVLHLEGRVPIFPVFREKG